MRFLDRSGEESWEPESLMDCDDLIQDYENELAAALAANFKGKHKRIEEGVRRFVSLLRLTDAEMFV